MRGVRILLYVVILIHLSSCATNNSNKEIIPKSIKVEYAKPYIEGLTTNFMGKVVANKEVNFAFRVAGTIENIPIKLGQAVSKGEIVAELDIRDYKTQLLATKAEYRQIKAEAERIIELYNRKSLPKNDYDKAVSALEQITAKLTAHQNALDDCYLRAPIDGKIQRIIYSKGETVGAGTPIISMISSNNFEVEIFVPSSFYSKMEGNHLCRIPILSDKSYSLKFLSIVPKANANGLYNVRFRILGIDNNKLVAGMSSSVTINNSLHDNKLVTIPLSSIFEHNGESHIWIYNDQTNRVSLRKIKAISLLNSGEIVIKEGVKSGEMVVVAGINSIDEDMIVKSLPKNSATNIGGIK